NPVHILPYTTPNLLLTVAYASPGGARHGGRYRSRYRACGLRDSGGVSAPLTTAPGTAPVAYAPREARLLAVQLYNQLFVNILIDVFTARQRDHSPDQFVGVDYFEPPRTTAPARSLERPLDVNVVRALLADRDLVTDLHLEGGDVHLAPVDADVPVAHELARLAPRHGEAKAENHVVQAAFEQFEQHLACHAFPLCGLFKIVAELRFKQVVDSLDALFFAQLFAVAYRLATRVRAVLPGRIGPSLFARACRLVALLRF